MVVEVTCPFPGCDHVSRNDDAAIVVELLKVHGLTHWWENGKAQTPYRIVSWYARNTGITPAYFETRWVEYRDGTHLRRDDIVVQLLECCDDELRRDLTRSNGGTEVNVLAAIKVLAVRSENIMMTCARDARNKFDHSTPESRVKLTPVITESSAPMSGAKRWSTSPAKYCATHSLAVSWMSRFNWI